ncbi:hypothetical protein GCM10011497_25960 [Elstera cyanobacteriorum]|nr:hypothetical protein GCM10011497_25960 [Elstera cyanobacteriorum]
MDAPQINFPGLGQRDTPRRPLKQPKAERLFYSRHHPRYPGRIDPAITRNLGKGPPTGDFDKQAGIVQIH